jgi:hypothetical protein
MEGGDGSLYPPPSQNPGILSSTCWAVSCHPQRPWASPQAGQVPTCPLHSGHHLVQGRTAPSALSSPWGGVGSRFQVCCWFPWGPTLCSSQVPVSCPPRCSWPLRGIPRGILEFFSNPLSPLHPHDAEPSQVCLQPPYTHTLKSLPLFLPVTKSRCGASAEARAGTQASLASSASSLMAANGGEELCLRHRAPP